MKFKKAILILLVLVSMLCPVFVLAGGLNEKEEPKYFFENVIKTDNEFNENKKKEITPNDPHYNWKLGRFQVSGFTSRTEEGGEPVFLKTLGDKITLSFELSANIDDLKGDGIYSISEDKNGLDRNFQTEKTNLERGALFVRHTDWQNSAGKVQTYTNYLTGKVVGANTEIQMLEEGDYEVALDYEIKKNNSFLIVPLPASYTNYRLLAKFKVRNGECMVYLFDVKTKTELNNNSITENGFYIDLAKSRYLDVTVKRKIYIEDEETISEDTRFNRVVKDGNEYTEEGIYTIVVKNRYTGETEEKNICVGNNKILKANFTQGISVKEYKERMSNQNNNLSSISFANDKNLNNGVNNMNSRIIIVFSLLVVLSLFVAIRAKNKNNKKQEVKKAEEVDVQDPEEVGFENIEEDNPAEDPEEKGLGSIENDEKKGGE